MLGASGPTTGWQPWGLLLAPRPRCASCVQHVLSSCRTLSLLRHAQGASRLASCSLQDKTIRKPQLSPPVRRRRLQRPDPGPPVAPLDLDRKVRDVVQELAGARGPEQALAEIGDTLSSVEWGQVIKELGRRGCWQSALQIVKWLCRPGQQPVDAALYATAISTLGREGHVIEALELFDSMKQHGTLPTSHVYTALIGVYARLGDFKEARRWLAVMKKAGCKPTVFTYSSLLAASNHANAPAEQVAAIVEEMEQDEVTPNLVIYNTLLTSHARQGNSKAALSLLEWLRYPNKTSYNAALDACAKGGEPLEVLWGLFERMKGAGIEPCDVTYSTLIAACSAAGDMSAAERLFKERRSTGARLSQVILTPMLDAYAEAGDFQSALELFEEAERTGCRPTPVPCRALIKAAARGGVGLPGMHELWQSFERKGVKPDRRAVCIMMTAYGKEGLWREAERLFQELDQREHIWLIQPFHALLDVYRLCGLWTKAKALFLELQNRSIPPDLKICNLLLSSYCYENQPLEAEELMLDMIKGKLGKECYPEAKSFSLILNMYAQEGRVSDFERVFSRMVKGGFNWPGVQPTVFQYNIRIAGYIRAGLFVKAAKVFQEMVRAGIEPDDVTFTTLCSGFGKGGQLAMMEVMLQEMRTEGRAPSQATYTAVIAAYTYAGAYPKAAQGLLDLESAGFAPSRITFITLCTALASAATWQEAEPLFGALKQSRIEAFRTLHSLLTLEEGISETVEVAEELRADTLSSQPPPVTSDGRVTSVRPERLSSQVTPVRAELIAQLLESPELQDLVPCCTLVEALWAKGLQASATAVLGASCQLGRLPGVNLGGPPGLNLDGPPGVTLGNSPAVSLKRLPRVNLGGLPAVTPSGERVDWVLDLHGLTAGAADPAVLLWLRNMRDFLKGQAKVRGQVSGVNGQASGAKGQVSGANGQVSVANGQVSGANGQVSGANGQVSGANGQVSSANGQVSGTKGQVSGGANGHPSRARIITGWGKHSKFGLGGFSLVNIAAYRLLESLKSPFAMAEGNEGALEATGLVFKEWLLSPGMEEVLEFKDRRT